MLSRPGGKLGLSAGTGRDTLPAWLSSGRGTGRVEQNDLAVFGQKNIGREGFVSIGGAVAKATLVPASDLPALADRWNSRSLSVGGGYGPFSANIIGRVIEAYAGRFGYGVVRDYTGHGVHTAFHSGLVILHYDEPRLDTPMEPGMTFTIEPMLCLGDHRSHQWDDGWTVLTNDASRVAQFEQTIVITDSGAEILTKLD